MKNQITTIGIGKLGLCFALILEKVGYEVVGVDCDKEYVDKINSKEFISSESQVNKFLSKSKCFRATTDINYGLDSSNIIFLFVATPSLEDGSYDHSQINRVVDQIINYGVLKEEKHLIIGCTTMPGYCDVIKKKLAAFGYIVSYNPEFIAQGSIINDLMNPDILLIGQGCESAGIIITKIYSSFLKKKPLIHRMSLKEAEITKIALNCFLTTKISFANMVGDIVKSAGCDPNIVLNAIGSDTRIGNKNMKYGFGFGGPCLPRDNRAFKLFAKEFDIDACISTASDNSNKLHLKFQVDDFVKNNNISDLVVLSQLAYKLGTDIIEESQALAFAVEIAEKGYKVKIKDKEEILQQIKDQYGNLFLYEIA